MKTFDEIKIDLLKEYRDAIEVWKKTQTDEYFESNGINDEKEKKYINNTADRKISAYLKLIENIDERVKREIISDSILLARSVKTVHFDTNCQVSRIHLSKEDDEYKKLKNMAKDVPVLYATEEFVKTIAKHYDIDVPSFVQTEEDKRRLESDQKKLGDYYRKNGRETIVFDEEMKLLNEEEKVELNRYLLGDTIFDDLRTLSSIKAYYNERKEQLNEIYQSQQNNTPMSM